MAMDAKTLEQLCYREGWTPRLRDETYWYAHRTADGKPQSVYLCTNAQLARLEEDYLLEKLRSKGQRASGIISVEHLPGGVMRIKKAGRAINVDERDQDVLRAALSKKGTL
jgi:hypothetical protein